MKGLAGWLPAGVLTLGAGLVATGGQQYDMPLRLPLADAIPMELAGRIGTEVPIPDDVAAVAGMSSYVARVYDPPEAGAGDWFTLYVGYYESQRQGRTIHSPRNCLPGSGWEALSNQLMTIETEQGPVEVNRYLLQKDNERAVVLYWYQGRGRVTASEYAVKWELLRDAALHGRTEEALVRIAVGIEESEEASARLAADVAALVIPQVLRALPEAPGAP